MLGEWKSALVTPGARAAAVQAPPTVAPKPQAGEPGFRLASAVAKRGGLAGTAVAGEVEPMAQAFGVVQSATR